MKVDLYDVKVPQRFSDPSIACFCFLQTLPQLVSVFFRPIHSVFLFSSDPYSVFVFFQTLLQGVSVLQTLPQRVPVL